MQETINQFCQCKQHIFTDLPQPLFRVICHCKTCQQFLSGPYNDECTFNLTDCNEIDLAGIEFQPKQKLFTIIRRGICRDCGKPSFCKAQFGSFIGLLMIPTVYLDQRLIPEPRAQIYCKHQQVELEVDCKKAVGHYSSQLTLMGLVFKSLLNKRK